MTAIYLGAPTSAPVDIAPETQRLHMTWTGYDGSTWDFSDYTKGVCLAAGVRGLTMPPVDWYTSDLAGVDGTTDRGYRVSARDVFWPLRIWRPKGGQDWLNVDADFWRTLMPGRYGTWKVEQPSGAYRTLRLRLANDGDQAWDTDPAVIGWGRYGIRLTAPQPYWEGPRIRRSFSAGSGAASFFNSATKAPPYRISGGSTLGTATIPNVGDVDAWPVWVLTGPITSASVGIGTRQIVVSSAISSGRGVIIDTNPTAQTAFDGPLTTDSEGLLQVADSGRTEVTGSLGATDFAPIAPGESVPLTLTVVGTGSVRAEVIPRYYRAW